MFRLWVQFWLNAKLHEEMTRAILTLDNCWYTIFFNYLKDIASLNPQETHFPKNSAKISRDFDIFAQLLFPWGRSTKSFCISYLAHCLTSCPRNARFYVNTSSLELFAMLFSFKLSAYLHAICDIESFLSHTLLYSLFKQNIDCFGGLKHAWSLF